MVALSRRIGPHTGWSMFVWELRCACNARGDAGWRFAYSDDDRQRSAANLHIRTDEFTFARRGRHATPNEYCDATDSDPRSNACSGASHLSL